MLLMPASAISSAAIEYAAGVTFNSGSLDKAGYRLADKAKLIL
jgi:hypothetical protein